MKEKKGITVRCVIIGLFLIPINCFWVLQSEVIWTSLHATVLSLFYNAVFTIFSLTVLNLLIQRFMSKHALSRAEFLCLYVMINIATALSSHDMLEILLATMGHAHWYATPENDWANLFFRYLPDWLIVSDKNVLGGYYRGDSSIFIAANLRAWLTPLALWLSFAVVLVAALLSLSALILRRWSEHEKLSYPIIQLPMEMTKGGDFFSNKLMWLGFCLSASLEIFRDLNSYFPAIPSPRVGLNLALFFTDRPFNAIRWLPLHFYPFVVGLAYFMPLDLSFSVWFFYLFWKVQLVLRNVLGMKAPSGFYMGDQSVGAWFGIGIFALFSARKYLFNIAISVFRREKAVKQKETEISYNSALIILVVSLAYLLIFLWKAGLSIWAGAGFVLLYLLISITVARMRAELGPPTHDLYYAGPDRTLVSIIGTRRFSPKSLTVFSLLYWLSRDYRSHPMPHQLEGLKIAQQIDIDQRKLSVAIMLAAIVGVVSFCIITLYIFYHDGMRYINFLGGESFNRLERLLAFPRGPDVSFIRQMSFGLLLCSVLALLRRRFIWWPFHPVGYAVSGSWTMSWMWFSVFISWLIKGSILKFSGLRTYRNAVPFFLGLILGQYIVGSLWTIIGIVFQIPVHSFFV